MKRIALALFLLIPCVAAYATTPAVPNPGAVITFDGANCPEPTTTADLSRSAPEICTTDIQGGGKMILEYQLNLPQTSPPPGDGVLGLTFAHIWTGTIFWSGSITYAVGDNQGGWSHFNRVVGSDGFTYGLLNISTMSACSDQHQPFIVIPNDVGTGNFTLYFRLRTTNYGWWELLETIPAGFPGAGTHQHFTFGPTPSAC